MARGNIRFTPGLLTQLGSFGQGPENQQGAAGASMLPPAQQFGPSGLGGMFARNLGTTLGLDMRTPGERLSADIANVPEDDPKRLEKQINLQIQAALRAGDRATAAKLAGTLENSRARQAVAANALKPKAGLSSSELFVQKGEDGKNYYYRSTPTATGGAVSEQITPVGGHNREFNPEDRVLAVGGQFLETARENLDRVVEEAGETEAVQGWEREKLAFSKELPKVQSSLRGIRGMIEVLEGIETGGVAVEAEQAVSEFFNIPSPQAIGAAKLKKMAAKAVLDQLKATVGGNPSDGERKALNELQADIAANKEVNMDTLRRAEDALINAQQRLIYGIEAEKREDYFDYIIKGGAYDSLFDTAQEEDTTIDNSALTPTKGIVGGRSGRPKRQLPNPDEVDAKYFK